MKKGVSIHISFTNRAIYTFIALAIFLVIGVTVFAFGTSNPSTFGHSIGELDLSGGIDGDVVFRGNIDVVGNLDVTQGLDVAGGLNVAGNVKGTGLCIGNDCRISWPSDTTFNTTFFSSPKKNGLPIAIFGARGWSTWNKWCQEKGYSNAISPGIGPTANPCCGNAAGTNAFTSWKCNWKCNAGTLSSITCMK